jgi:hypothetical protein
MYEYLYTHIFKDFLMARNDPATSGDIQDLVKAITNNRGPSGPSPSGGGGGFLDNFDLFGKAQKIATTGMQEMYTSGKKVADQNYTFANAGQSVSNVLGSMGTTGQLFGTVLSDLATYGQDSVESWQRVSKFGLDFGGDAIGLRTSAAQTRMSYGEYEKFLTKNKDQLAGLGVGINGSVEAFNKLSGDFFNSALPDGAGSAADSLKRLGYTNEELNDVLAVTMQSQRTLNLNDEKARKSAMESAFQLAEQMDAVAKLTGKTREEQLKALKDKQSDAAYYASEKLATQGLNEQDKQARIEAIEAMKNTLGSLGPATDKLVKDLFTGGARGAEAVKTLQAMGPAGKQIIDAVKAAKTATAATKEEAAKQAEQATNSALLYQRSNAALKRAELLDDSGRALLQDNLTTQKNLDAIAKANGFEIKTTQDIAKAKEILAKKTKEDAEKAKTEGGGETTKFIVDFNSRVGDAGSALNKHIIQPLNQSAGKFLKDSGASKQMENIRYTKDASGKQVAESSSSDRMGAKLATGRDIIAKGASDGYEKLAEVIQKALNLQMPGGTVKHNIEKAESWIKDGVMNITNMVTGNRDIGTLGKTGQMFEPADFFGKVAKGETVMTQAQLQKMALGIQSDAVAQASNVSKNKAATGGNDKLPSISNMGMGGLSEVKEELVKLNSSVALLVQISSTTADNSSKQIRATKGLGGNLFA